MDRHAMKDGMTKCLTLIYQLMKWPRGKMYISICTLPYQLLNRTENKCLCSSTAPSACGRMLANKRGRSVQGNNIKMSPASFRLPASNSLFINHAFFTDLTDITVHSLGEAKQYESFTFDDRSYWVLVIGLLV